MLKRNVTIYRCMDPVCPFDWMWGKATHQEFCPTCGEPMEEDRQAAEDAYWDQKYHERRDE